MYFRHCKFIQTYGGIFAVICTDIKNCMYFKLSDFIEQIQFFGGNGLAFQTGASNF